MNRDDNRNMWLSTYFIFWKSSFRKGWKQIDNFSLPPGIDKSSKSAIINVIQAWNFNKTSFNPNFITVFHIDLIASTLTTGFVLNHTPINTIEAWRRVYNFGISQTLICRLRLKILHHLCKMLCKMLLLSRYHKEDSISVGTIVS